MLAEVVDALDGRLAEPPPLSVTGVSTDSRSVQSGELFFALRGDNFDGHEFVGPALERGAVGAVVAASKLADVRDAVGRGDAVLIPVDDPIAALGRLAAFHRGLVAAEVIAVVGSNGKTTTKSMIDHVLAARLVGRCSPKSFNNAIGVPLTLLSAEAKDDYLVAEIGTNAPGEIAALAGLVQPDIAVITSIGEEHLEGFDDLEGVAAEECSVLSRLRRGGFAAVNLDSPLIGKHPPPEGVTLVTYGEDPKADVRISAVRYERPWLNFRINERYDYRLPLPGAHNAHNAAAAIVLARRLGFEPEEIAARLETLPATPMRMELIELGGITILNDAYNANPSSAAAAVKTLLEMPCRGRRVAVIGEMRELGRHAVEKHRRLAERLADSELDLVVPVGAAAEWMAPALADMRGPVVEAAETVEAAATLLCEKIAPGDVVLLKASRAVRLERVLPALAERFADQSARTPVS